MSIYTTDIFLTDRNGGTSLMNLNILDYLTENDYFQITISDQYKYRLDKIARDYIGDSSYYYFIIWINSFDSLDDLDSGNVINIPTLSFIQRYRNEMKLVRGIN